MKTFRSCLLDLDLALAAFYEVDLLPVERRQIDALVTFYSLIKYQDEESLKSLAK